MLKSKDKVSKSKIKLIRLIIKLGYMLLTAVVMASVMALGHYLHHCCSYPIIGTVISAIALLGAGWMIITLLHRVMQKSISLIIAFITVFTYGVVVYSIGGESYEVWFADLLSPINSSLSMFFPSRGGYEKGYHDMSILYTTVHILSYLYIAMLGASLFGRRVINRSMNRLTFPCNKNIFWGYSDGGVLLAKDIMSKTIKDRAVFLMPENMSLSKEIEKFRFEEIDKMGGVVLYRDFSKEINIKAARHFFLTEDQDLNVKLAFNVLRAIENESEENYTIELFVRTELTHVDRYFSKILEKLKTKVEVNTINESELTARYFIDEYHPLDMPGIEIAKDSVLVKGEFNVLQLGYGWTGKAILDKIICNTQFIGSRSAEGKTMRCNFSATVFDRDLMTKHGFYPLLDKECINTTESDAVNYYNITTNSDIEVGSFEFKEWIEKNVWLFNRVIVALGDDALNIQIALSIAKVLNSNNISYSETSKIIFAHIRNTDCYSYFDADDHTPITVFGNKDKIYTMEVIVNDELDSLAKELNHSYAKFKGNREVLWHKATILDQDSSRAAAAGIDNTLRLDKKRRIKSSDATHGVKLNFDKATLEILAENEHLRWNAFHFTKGIKCWDISDVTYETFQGGKPKPNRISELNRHAALIPYSELKAKVDDKFNPWRERYNQDNNPPKGEELEMLDMKENDRKFVRDINALLNRIDNKAITNESE